MAEQGHHVQFGGRLLMIGFGAIGRGVLPLLLRHIDMRPDQVTILKAHVDGAAEAQQYGVTLLVQPLTRENFRDVLAQHVGPGDFVLNLAINVSSLALIEYCQEHGLLYADACIEPWAGGHLDAALSVEQRSNYGYREAALELRRRFGGGPTAVLMHGANPGIVSHFVKQALLDLAADQAMAVGEPQGREQWAQLACDLGIKVIHVAERDTQIGRERKQRGEFVNTWSSEAFVDESCQPAELGWGSHERTLPADGRRFAAGDGCAIYLDRPGAATRVRSWTPQEGPFHGFLISHGEAMSLAAYLSLYRDGRLHYRPTVHYAYHPCDDAVLSLHELAGKEWRMQPRLRLLQAGDIVAGIDELGVLLLGHRRGAYWYGSQLSTDEARTLVPHNSATTLQVTAGVLGAVVWALRHPAAGIVEPDELDHREIMAIATPYLGPMVGVYSDWTPLQQRSALFDESGARDDDPWQFTNFLVR